MNLIAFRFPNETKRHIYEAYNAPERDFKSPEKSFVISPFDPSKPPLFYSLGAELKEIPDEIVSQNNRDYTFEDTDKEDYKLYLEEIKSRLEGDLTKKIIASRRVTSNCKLSPSGFFEALCERYPEAFIFLISTAQTGTWIGASPELLLSKKGSECRSMALAGTRKISETEREWDEKNRREHEIVIHHIENTFLKFGIMPDSGVTTTKRAGKIEHLMTPIIGKSRPGTDFGELLSELSPTPALGGHPRELALHTIKEFEPDRELYGGYCGMIDGNGDFSLYVILRCALLQNHDALLFAGGGITAMSEIEDEWQETENKLNTLRSVMNGET